VNRLPVLDAASRACHACHGPCCFEYSVPVTGFELCRLASGLGVPWRAIADLSSERDARHDAFRLDRGPAWHLFVLKRRASGACLFLVEIDDTHRRCGVHPLRPGPCRMYPLVVGDDGLEIGEAALCPAEPAAIYQDALVELRPIADERLADRALYRRALARWEALAARTPAARPLTAEIFVDWIGRLAAALDPLRNTERGERGERGAWQPAAYLLIDAFPLPAH
jgi:Fe-S-cluster containining protein